VGKPWALQRGLEAARGEIVVCLDADTRPKPGLASALVAALQAADLVSAGARFDCDTAGERWLHPALLATLVYRFGPPDSTRATSPRRLVISGQCTAARRQPLLTAGGYRAASGYLSDDVALARALALKGWTIAFHDGGDLISVDMHDSALGTWGEWGRTIALQDVTPRALLMLDVAVIWLVLGLPSVRLLSGRAGTVDLALLALRLLMSAAMASAYARRGPAYWLSPLADPLAALRITISALRPPRAWRGRIYGFAPGTGAR
jgi:dolichol-phosphate mannosyltransferase